MQTLVWVWGCGETLEAVASQKAKSSTDMVGVVKQTVKSDSDA